MASPAEIDAMRLAIALSAHGLGTTSPNPPVGCVILRADGQVVGTGYHQRKGESHAEVHALAAAGSRAERGTAIVTLEPCNHIGRTPACRQALLDARIARVVIAVIDPTSRGGGGAAMLRAAGVAVEVGVLADEAQLVLGPWLAALERHRPFVVGGYAVGKDGLEPLDTDVVNELRTGVDAVLYDDGRVEEGVPYAHGHRILDLPSEASPEDAGSSLSTLYTGGVRSILLIGAADVVAALARNGLVDKLIVEAPMVAEASSDTTAFAVPAGYRTVTIAKIGPAVRAVYERATGTS